MLLFIYLQYRSLLDFHLCQQLIFFHILSSPFMFIVLISLPFWFFCNQYNCHWNLQPDMLKGAFFILFLFFDSNIQGLWDSNSTITKPSLPYSFACKLGFDLCGNSILIRLKFPSINYSTSESSFFSRANLNLLMLIPLSLSYSLSNLDTFNPSYFSLV